jgi:ketosteroid isomerase-like protein
MSENVEATQNLFRIWNTREFEALIPFVTEDVVWKPATMEAVEGGSFEGVQGLRQFFDEWDKTWRVWEVEPREIREVDDRVLVLGHVHAEGRESGLALDQPAAYLFEFRDGLLARGATYFDHDEAIAAAEERGGAGAGATP